MFEGWGELGTALDGRAGSGVECDECLDAWLGGSPGMRSTRSGDTESYRREWRGS
jgi:hypothetical protein